jgi:hypothetical protein
LASDESVKELFKQQTLKKPKLVQSEKVLYTQFIAVHSKGKPVSGPMMIEKADLFMTK